MNNKVTKWGITLTPRQWATYRLLKIMEEVTQKDIVDNYPYDPVNRKDGYVWNDSPKCHDHCPSVWTDINDINNNPDIHKIIIADHFVYSIARNKEQVESFIKETYYKPAIAKLVRLSNIRKKVARNNQGKLIFNDDSKERDYWETFIDEIIAFDKKQ